MFQLSPGASVAGTALVDTVSLPPAFFVARFGPPSRADEYKVSGQYVFADDAGNVFTVHDWKGTTMYYGEGDTRVPSPAAFWADQRPQVFTIGGRGEENEEGTNLTATAFREWLLEQYRGFSSAQAN